jgi:hypothetical protein
MAKSCRHLVQAWGPSINGVASRPQFHGPPRYQAQLTMKVGDVRRFQVVLQPGFYTGWTRPASSAPRSVGLSGVRDQLRDGVSYNCLISGTIIARATGTALVSSGTDLPCFHVRDPCLAPAVDWRMKVRVTSR